MKQTEHILVVEDDPEIGELIEQHLTGQGWKVSLARHAGEMERVLHSARIDLVVLDLMLPGEDGLSICRRLRGTSSIPIIIVSAKADDFDRVIGLEVGADDYLPKPFNPRELIARIRAMFRRVEMGAATPAVSGKKLGFDGWVLDCETRHLFNPKGALVSLTPAEFDLLQVLCERHGRVLSREQLVELTQGINVSMTGRNIDILVSRLRSKMDAAGARMQFIRTVRAGGYEFVGEVKPV
ncbi:response regulator [Pannonibacter indicus]|jgi:two-component system OmpR family response regulator|uniref:DNA-binding response regulator, OmpR family, contains REC and winged-helix (WHTH) domain n=1 Tax=Pannonibacter indicus TaxID=466044 RepID=A0A0K6HM93_9HYPH|nr:response regulator [Pannonibacter indicus]CUA91951.1 DNA-binding response regulator, OmpR family, contains REC and winged-helix (wHTH) domain [Pannonibacter indicus]